MWHANPAQVRAIALAAGDDQFSLLIPHCFQFVDRVDDIQRIEAVEMGNVLQPEQYIIAAGRPPTPWLGWLECRPGSEIEIHL